MAVWGMMKKDYNVDIDKNEAYKIGDLITAIKSLINSNSRVKIIQGLYRKGQSKYAGMSCVDSLWTANTDVAGSMGNELQQIELDDGKDHTWKYARAKATFQLMAVTTQFPPSLKDLREPVQKIF